MAGRFSHMSLSSLLTDNQKLFLEKNQSQVDKFLSEIPPKFSFSKHQSELFEFYLYQSYGIDLEKKISPAIACFIDASCPSYSGEENDICGDIELSPVVVCSSDGVNESLPPGADAVSMSYCRLLLQAFPGLKTDMISPAESLDRQLSHLESMFSKPKETWVSSYDRLSIEKIINNKIRPCCSKSEIDSQINLSIEKALEYGKYLYSQHSSLKNRKVRIIQTCWGETPSQYQNFVEKILPYCKRDDVLGLSGWGIFALEKNYLSTFWDIIFRIVPIIAKSAVKKIHLFDVTWSLSYRGCACTPLASLLWLCDKCDLELSCSGNFSILSKSPILNSLQKFDKETNVLHSYWRVNLALTRTLLASIRNYEAYQSPPNLLLHKNLYFTIYPKPKWKLGDRIYNSATKVCAQILRQINFNANKDYTYLVCREDNKVREIWSERDCQLPPTEKNQIANNKVSQTLESSSNKQEKCSEEVCTNLNNEFKTSGLGRPKGSKNQQKSQGSFYMRGISKKGVEQWSYHYHLFLSNGLIKKSSISVPNSKLEAAKNIAKLQGIEEVIRFLKTFKSTDINFGSEPLGESNDNKTSLSVDLVETLEEPNIETIEEVNIETIEAIETVPIITKRPTLNQTNIISKVEFSEYKTSDGNFLTKEQIDILEAVSDRMVKSEKKGLLIEALAGTGKSTMLVEVAKVLKGKELSSLECIFIVFGRKNKQDLAEKLSKIKWEKSVQTINSLGYKLLREALGKNYKQFKLSNGKYEKIAQNKGYLNSHNEWGEKIPGKLQLENQDGEFAIKSKKDFVNLVDKIRLHCYLIDELTKDDIWNIASKYGIEIFKSRLSEITEAVLDVLKTGLNEGINKLHIDFIDQIWLLWHEKNLYKNVFLKWSNNLKVISIDECQDVDLLQIEFIKLLHKPSNNFIIAVGDRFQAIYLFRGAMSNGIDIIAEKFNCDRMPLTTNWRCGKKHIELVRNIYPDINLNPSPTALEGEIRIIKENHFLDIFDEADKNLSFFGISRKNAPLLVFAIRLLTFRYPVRIKDRNLGTKLLEKVREIVNNDYDVNTFLSMVDNWFELQSLSLKKLPEKVQEQKLIELQDYYECLVVLFEKFKPKSLNSWKTEIDKIFDESTTTRKIIDLYTIHSGKGGEGHYTFILYPENMPIKFEKQSQEEKQQEQHMIYVALTRCLARAKGGILWLVLENRKEDKTHFPEWLPRNYRKLWKCDESEIDNSDEIDDSDVEF